MGRRTFLATTAATGAAAVGAMPAVAATSLNYGSDLVQNPAIEAIVDVEEVDLSEMGALDYVADDGSTKSLEEHGGRLQEREDETTAHNPIQLAANWIDADEYSAFPRGAKYDGDSDGEEDEDVSALRATHWSTDESGSAGSISISDTESAAGGPALNVATSGQTSGDTALATFTHSDFSIDSGEDRKYLQLVANVNTLEAGAVVDVIVRDSGGNQVSATIDPSADGSADDVIATATGTGIVYQRQLGEWSTSLDGIDEVEISIAEANADVDLVAVNLERERTWQFGTREYKNSDDELDTETVTAPSGTYSITELSTLDDAFGSAVLGTVTYDMAFESSGLPAEHVDYEFIDAPKYSYDRRFQAVKAWELPSAYTVSYADEELTDEVMVPGDRFINARFATGLSEVPALDDVEDISWTSRSDSYGAVGDDVSLSTAISATDIVAVNFDYQVSSDEESSMTSSGNGGGAGAAIASGGGGFLSSTRGMLIALLSGVGAGWALLRSRFWG